MSTPLEVLVVETEQGGAAEAVAALEGAGHRVHRCHEPGGPAFPCAGVVDRAGCPLERRAIDVAVTVRRRPRAQPSPLEDGLACAIRRHVPVVVAGNDALNPYADYAVAVAGHDDIVAVCERVADGDLPEHCAAATAAVESLPAIHGREPGSRSVSVRRRHGGLAVRLDLGDGIDRRTADMAAIRVVAALRALDPYAGGIDVEIAE